MLRRTSKPTKSSGGVGGAPRPSLKWQEEQELALKVGPSPSCPVVEEGAVTQPRLNMELPTKKRSRRESRRLRAESEYERSPVSKTVVSPPDSSSPGSASACWDSEPHPGASAKVM